MSVRGDTDAQRLDERIRLVRSAYVQDGEGATHLGEPELLIECWAAADAERATAAQERLVEGTERSTATITFWIRYDVRQRVGLTLKDGVVWKGRRHDILALPDQGPKGRLQAILATAGVEVFSEEALP